VYVALTVFAKRINELKEIGITNDGAEKFIQDISE